MGKQKTYLILTLLGSILVRIVLPLAIGVRDLTLIAICFSSIWVIYAVILLMLTFLVKPGLKIKTSHKNGVTVARYELSNAERTNEEIQR